ncbi:MAG: hypothetical protein GY870_22055 [archaeon]|nr:hypothetical protein [archaeon]
MKGNKMKQLEEVLTEEEANFVRCVYSSNGGKYACNRSYYEDDGTRYGKTTYLNKNPEKLGLIKSVGSYKWVATDKLDICIKEL